MLIASLHNYLLEQTVTSNGLLILLLIFLAIGLINCVRVHQSSNLNGVVATALNFILLGLGQVYMKQFKLGISLSTVFIFSYIFYDHIPFLVNQFNKQYYFLLILGITYALQYILFKHAQQRAQSTWLHKIAALKYQRLVPVIEKGTILCVDTNILLHEPLFLVAAFRDSDVHIYVSKQVYFELDGLKKNKNPDVRSRTQLGFDLIEMFQSEGRLTMLEIPPHTFLRDRKLTSSADEYIIGTYLYAKNQVQNPVAFLSNDKGARILAQNASLDVVTI